MAVEALNYVEGESAYIAPLALTPHLPEIVAKISCQGFVLFFAGYFVCLLLVYADIIAFLAVVGLVKKIFAGLACIKFPVDELLAAFAQVLAYLRLRAHLALVEQQPLPTV